MAEPRVVAGLSCTDVLARLSEFVDGELSAETRDQILAHLAGCTWCEEFGGRFSGLVTMLRSQSEPAGLDESVARRLQEFLSEGLLDR